MNRQQLEQYISVTYNADPDHPWDDTPEYAVYRHRSNRKWFALVMSVPADKLGLPSGGSIDVVNLKCDPILTGSLRGEPGFFPAYHMNKERWITAALTGDIPDDKLKMLLDMSFEATAPKQRSPRSKKT